MRLVDTDVVWAPRHGVRVELHGTNWTRTEGDRWTRAYDTQDPNRETDRLLGMFILFKHPRGPRPHRPQGRPCRLPRDRRIPHGHLVRRPRGGLKKGSG